MAGTKNSGRKPKLSAVNAPHKEQRKRAIQSQENNKDFDELTAAPYHLSASGKKLYNKIAKELTRKNILVELDKTLLVTFVENVELSHQAMLDIKKHGIILIDEKGNVKKNPACDVKNNADKNVKSMGSSLGLDPMSRASLLSTKPVEAPNEEMNDFLKVVSGNG